MNQDKTNPPPQPFIPGNFPTVRANGFSVMPGGDFTLILTENRQVSVEGAVVWASVEVGRYVIDPVAMVWLQRNIEKAVGTYEALFGHGLPNPEAVAQKLKAEAAAEQLQNQLRMPPGQPNP